MAKETLGDPTLDALHQFADASLWKILPNVPVFDEHSETREVPKLDDAGRPVKNADGSPVNEKVKVVFDEAKLQEIAANCNRREMETGDACPLVIGHTDDDKPESEQPEHVGYARHFHVGRFGPAKKLSILSTWYVMRGKAEKVKKYPRRSVEYWDKDGIFDPISLIIRTPQRDLGLLTYERRLGRRIYTMEDTSVPDQEANDKKQESLEQELPKEHKEMAEKYARHLLSSHPAFRFLHHKYMAECANGDKPMQYDAGAPAGSNTYIPSGPGDKDKNPMTPDQAKRLADNEGPERMRREQDAIRYSKLEQTIVALQEQVQTGETAREELARKYQRAERERDLIQLEAEGFVFERAGELADVEDLPAEKYTRHLDKIRKSYRRNPNPGKGFIETKLPDDPDSGTKGKKGVKKYGKEVVERALRHIKDHPETTYPEALEIAAKIEQ